MDPGMQGQVVMELTGVTSKIWQDLESRGGRRHEVDLCLGYGTGQMTVRKE